MQMLQTASQAGKVFAPVSFEKAISRSVVPDAAMMQIDLFAKEFPVGQLFAVRSSAIHEDMEDNAFAGAYTTFLNVGRDDLQARIKDCILAQDTPAVKTYLQHNATSTLQMSMAVLVQPQIVARSSGVCFTSAPLSPWHVNIEIESGLAGATGGKTTPSQYYLDRRSGACDFEKARPRRPELVSPDVIKRIAQLGLQIEDFRGGAMEPRDIEFAIDVHGNVTILQDRPDTSGRVRLRTLVEEWPKLQPSGKWKLHNDNSYFPGGGIPALFLRPVTRGVASGYGVLSGSPSVEPIAFLEAKYRVFKSFRRSLVPAPWFRVLNHYHRATVRRQWVADVEQWHDKDRLSLLSEEKELKQVLKKVQQLSDLKLMESLKKAEGFLEKTSSMHRKQSLAAVMPHSELMLFCKDEVRGFDKQESISLSTYLMLKGDKPRSIFTAKSLEGSSALAALSLALKDSDIGNRLQHDPPKTEEDARAFLAEIQAGVAAKELRAWLDEVGHWVERGTITTATKAEEPMALLWALRGQMQRVLPQNADHENDIVASLKVRVKPLLVATFEELVNVAKRAHLIREERFVFASAAVGLFRLFFT